VTGRGARPSGRETGRARGTQSGQPLERRGRRVGARESEQRLDEAGEHGGLRRFRHPGGQACLQPDDRGRRFAAGEEQIRGEDRVVTVSGQCLRLLQATLAEP
jgi:hypothetical protein